LISIWPDIQDTLFHWDIAKLARALQRFFVFNHCNKQQDGQRRGIEVREKQSHNRKYRTYIKIWKLSLAQSYLKFDKAFGRSKDKRCKIMPIFRFLRETQFMPAVLLEMGFVKFWWSQAIVEEGEVISGYAMVIIQYCRRRCG